MWLFLGISAIIFTGFNLICSFKSKNAKWFRFGAISFTALTICSFYSDEAMRVLNEDWGGLMDIMPTMVQSLTRLLTAMFRSGIEDGGHVFGAYMLTRKE